MWLLTTLFRVSVRSSFRESNSGNWPPTGTMPGTRGNHSTTTAPGKEEAVLDATS